MLSSRPSLELSVSIWLDRVSASPPGLCVLTSSASQLHAECPNAPAFEEPCPLTISSTSESIASHNSGRLSPVKQLQVLAAFDEPIVFCNFDDDAAVDDNAEPEHVTAMRTEIQGLADGV